MASPTSIARCKQGPWAKVRCWQSEGLLRARESEPHHLAARGKGALLYDVDGNRYIDFAGGIGVLNVGHANAEVVEAIKEQAERFLHTCFSVMMYESYIELAQRLTEITPGSHAKKAMMVNSGAEAVENAVKIARYATGRPGIVAFDSAFHGRTMLTMTLTGKVDPYKYGFGPAAPEVYQVPAPYCYRCPCRLEYPSCGVECLSLLRTALKSRIAPDKVAAVIIEPVLGEGGFIVPLRSFSNRLDSTAPRTVSC